MADNYDYTPGSGGTAAGDLIGGVMYPRIKVTSGADGTATDVSTDAPLPVVQTGTPGLPTGAATAAKQLADGHNVAVNNSTGAAAVNIQDGGNTITVDGTVAVTHAGLTAINGAINSSKMDVNIASGNPTTITATQSTASNLKAEVTVAGSQTIAVTQGTASSLKAELGASTALIGAVKRDVINYVGINKYYSYTGAVTDGIVWSPAGGKKVVITDISMSLSAAGTVTLEWDKTGGDEAVMAFDLAANGGVSMNLQTPIACSEADADLVITTSAGNIKIMVSGYEI